MNDNKNKAACQTVVFSVYVLWCSKTDMHYVGVTSKKITARIRQYRRGKRQFLDREIQKIGWENFDWWVVEEGIPSELISECEKKMGEVLRLRTPQRVQSNHRRNKIFQTY